MNNDDDENRKRQAAWDAAQRREDIKFMLIGFGIPAVLFRLGVLQGYLAR